MIRNKKGQFVKGHPVLVGSEKGWFIKGQKHGPLSEETKKKIGLAHKGIPLTLAHRKKLSQNHRKFNSPESKLKTRLALRGEKNYLWKGDDVSYSGLHYWLRRELGDPISCEVCGKIGKFLNGRWTIEWANKDHQYKRNLEDWMSLCASCHRKYDSKVLKKLSMEEKLKILRGWSNAQKDRKILAENLAKLNG